MSLRRACLQPEIPANRVAQSVCFSLTFRKRNGLGASLSSALIILVLRTRSPVTIAKCLVYKRLEENPGIAEKMFSQPLGPSNGERSRGDGRRPPGDGKRPPGDHA